MGPDAAITEVNGHISIDFCGCWVEPIGRISAKHLNTCLNPSVSSKELDWGLTMCLKLSRCLHTLLLMDGLLNQGFSGAEGLAHRWLTAQYTAR